MGFLEATAKGVAGQLIGTLIAKRISDLTKQVGSPVFEIRNNAIIADGEETVNFGDRLSTRKIGRWLPMDHTLILNFSGSTIDIYLNQDSNKRRTMLSNSEAEILEALSSVRIIEQSSSAINADEIIILTQKRGIGE